MLKLAGPSVDSSLASRDEAPLPYPPGVRPLKVTTAWLSMLHEFRFRGRAKRLSLCRMRRSLFTPAFEAYVAPARPRRQLWRLALGLLLVAAVAIGLPMLALLLLRLWLGPLSAALLAGSMAHPVSPVPTLLVLASVAAMALGPMLAVRWVHGRPVGSLFGRAPRVLRDFVLAAVSVWLVAGLFTALGAVQAAPERNLSFDLWLSLLPLSLAGVLGQTLAEELLFRGYLMQSLAARIRWPVIWLALPAALFGLAHYSPLSNGANAWAVAVATGLVGLAAADLTRRTGTLGAAWGLHFANNVLALLVLATNGTITGLALWVTPYHISDPVLLPALLGDVTALTLAWILSARLTAR